jgi:PEP-CTERM motif
MGAIAAGACVTDVRRNDRVPLVRRRDASKGTSMKGILAALLAASALMISSWACAAPTDANYVVTYVGDNPFSGFPSDGGTGTFSCSPSNEGGQNCPVTKNFDALGDVPIIIDVVPNTDQGLLTGSDLIHFDETITNNTNFDWTDFHLSFFGIDNGPMTIEFQNVFFTGWLLSISTTNELGLVSASGSSLASGDSFNLSFDLQINTRPGDYDLFGISEQPSVPSVPEPATLALLGVALAGLGVSRRRKLN